MSQIHTRKILILDSSGNNPVMAKRIKKGEYYFPFPLVDKEGNEITEEQASRKREKKSQKGA